MSSKDNEKIDSVRQSLKTLNVQRESLEHESAAIVSELTSANPDNPTVAPMGIDTPLTDSDGYPRNDVDVLRARTLRGRLSEIKTDHKKLMEEIEILLNQLAVLQVPGKLERETSENTARMHQKPKPKYDTVTRKWVVRNWDGTIAGAGTNSDARFFDNLSSELPRASDCEESATTPAMIATSSSVTPLSPVVRRAAESNVPLARVESVAPTSPAFSAGLQHDDIILSFGSITQSWQDIADLVRSAAADQEVIEVRILRGNHLAVPKLVLLSPRPWNGRGLLGCHIVPI